MIKFVDGDLVSWTRFSVPLFDCMNIVGITNFNVNVVFTCTVSISIMNIIGDEGYRPNRLINLSSNDYRFVLIRRRNWLAESKDGSLIARNKKKIEDVRARETDMIIKNLLKMIPESSIRISRSSLGSLVGEFSQ